jgi:hypothetical protein
MTLHITERLITSTVTPETAHRIPLAEGGMWVLSWLPDRVLTRDQAISGLVLDETLSVPDTVHTEFAMELAAFRAADLGLTPREVVLRLCARMLERDQLAHNESGESDAVPGPDRSGYGDRPRALLILVRRLTTSTIA